MTRSCLTNQCRVGPFEAFEKRLSLVCVVLRSPRRCISQISCYFLLLVRGDIRGSRVGVSARVIRMHAKCIQLRTCCDVPGWIQPAIASPGKTLAAQQPLALGAAAGLAPALAAPGVQER